MFRIRIFLRDPGKNLHADQDPGGKGKNDFLYIFFHVSDDSEQLIKKIFFRIFQIFFGSKLSETDDLTKNICCLFP